jgi:amidophosphoribosyltransferase
VKKVREVSEELIREPLEKARCSFERIYFSRKATRTCTRNGWKLGRRLDRQILHAWTTNLEYTVFSFIRTPPMVAVIR